MHALSVSLLRAKQLPVITNGLGASPHAGSTCTIGVVTVRPLNRLPARLYFKLKPDPNNTFFFIFTCTTQYPWVLANLNLSQAMAPSKKKRIHTVFRDSSAHRSASTSKPRFVGERETVRLSEIAKIKAGNVAPKKDAFTEDGIPFVRAGSLTNLLAGGSLADLEKIDGGTAQKLRLTLFPAGTVVFAKSGMSCMTGNVYVLPNPCYVVSHLACVIPNGNYASYLEHYFRFNRPNRLIENPSFPSIKLSKIQGIELKLPSPEKGVRQVQALERIESQIGRATTLLTYLNSLVKSRFVEMFGELDTNPKGFQLTCFDDLGTWTSGGTPSRKNPSYFTGEIDWYSAGELNSLHLGRSKERISLRAIEESSAKLVPPGSLFVGMYDTAALKMGITTKESSSNQACANLVPNGIVDLVWLYFAIDQLKPSLLAKRSGCRQKTLA